MKFIDLAEQQAAIKQELDQRIAAVLAHGQYIMGPEVSELEAALSAYVGTKHCVTVASGTEALLIGLMALGVGPGDEVITTPFTFVATAEVVALLGATPVFVDIDPCTANIDPALIEAKITARTKAIIPVSLYGQVADLDEINAIATRHAIPVIEDAAQSLGATTRGHQSCSLTTIGCTSFFPSKPLGCYGDGGAMFTNSDELARTAQEIRVHGQSKRYVHTRIGVGGRMDTLQCAIVLAKMSRFPWEVNQRATIGARYTTLIHECISGAKTVSMEDVGRPLANIRTLRLKPDRTSVYAQYTVLIPRREEIQAILHEAGIPTAVHYPVPLNQQPAYKALGIGDPTPVSEWAAQHVMSLPMGPDLKNTDMELVVDTLAKVMS